MYYNHVNLLLFVVFYAGTVASVFDVTYAPEFLPTNAKEPRTLKLESNGNSEEIWFRANPPPSREHMILYYGHGRKATAESAGGDVTLSAEAVQVPGYMWTVNVVVHGDIALLNCKQATLSIGNIYGTTNTTIVLDDGTCQGMYRISFDFYFMDCDCILVPSVVAT